MARAWRRYLAGGVALAGLMAAPCAMAQSTPSSGFYMGGSGAGGFGGTSNDFNVIYGGNAVLTQTFSSQNHPSRLGALGGVDLGYQAGLGRFVLGSQFDFALGSIQSSSTETGTYYGDGFSSRQHNTLDRYSTLRALAGFAATPRILLYGFGGLAVGRVANETALDFANVPYAGPGSHYIGERIQIAGGLMAGGGVAYQLAPGWAATLEYQRYHLGRTSVVGYRNTLGDFHTQTDFPVDGNLVRLGIDYHFGNDAVADPYAVYGLDSAPYVAPDSQSPDYVFGTRYWYSDGTFRYNLNGQDKSKIASRLSYTGLHSNSAELFGRVATIFNTFIKFNIGVGTAGSGTLEDEDFPPAAVPYSQTASPQRGGAISYSTVDLGYNAWQRGGLRIGAFAGYSYYRQEMNAYGCTQVASNQGICGAGSVDAGALTITERAQWDLMRLGVATDWTLPWWGIKLGADAAWLPFGTLNGQDHHWLRIDVPSVQIAPNSVEYNFAGPINQTGAARGVQLEASLTIPITRMIDIGFGARYWYMHAHGASRVNVFAPTPSGEAVLISEVPLFQANQDTDYSTRRYGVFGSVNLHF